MVLNTKVTIAFKNESNFYEFKSIDIFKLDSEEPFTNLKLSIYKRKEFFIRAKCPLCGDYHNFKFNIYSLLTTGVAMGGCSLAQEPIIIIGNENSVISLIDKYKEVNLRISALI